MNCYDMHCFSICLCLIILDIGQGFEYASGSKYARVLDMPGFSLFRVSEYALVSCGSEYPWMCLNNLNIPKYVWILLNKQASEYIKALSTCYFVTLPNAENQLFIDGRA